jgi:hypothetical protein
MAPSSTDAVNGEQLGISGQVWADADGNGIEDPTEALTPGLTVRLLDGSGAVLASDTTGVDGTFEFASLPVGTYALEVDVPQGHAASPADQVPAGVEPEDADAVDSDFAAVDVIAGTARTQPIVLGGEAVDDIGLGLVPVPPDTATVPPTTAVPTTMETSTTEQPSTTVETSTTLATTSTTLPTTTTSEAPTTSTASPTTAPTSTT